MESSTQINSNDLETKGFSMSSGNTWIYPENYSVRQYQYNIVKTALYYNTLVCLPTGLGKTFIASVVMFNFWRWYPRGKIVFLAPTKPLVAQQIDACYSVMGISSDEMTELTGTVNQKNREIAWLKKNIIFATPQVFHNDLEKSIVPSHLVKCIVVDEAHKALGKHSYCECIRILSTQNQYFRILALSATPGNKIDNVHEVIQNLCISHLELRDENSLDIVPYINKRKVDTILVPLSNELAQFKEKYIIIMDRHVKFLIQCNIIRGQAANISKGRIFHLLQEFKKKTNKSGNYAQIMKTLNILLTMYHAYELMIRHGLRAFYTFYQNHSDKFWMHNEDELQRLLHDIKTYLGPFPEIFPNGDVSEMPTNIVFGHNKFYKLKELLEHHFRKNNDKNADTRAIVFVEYRDIVSEVYILLLQSKPLIRPQMFVGQASQKQKQQIKALEDFRSNHVNVLISTSIGEEGLDVGEVDLIICFDVSQHSPTRLVQRMGRTGRKRDGHIIILVTDGKECENLKSTLSKRDSLNNKILNTSNIFSSLYQNNPRMIPNQFTPECHMRYLNVLPKMPNVKGRKKKKNANKKDEISSTKQKESSLISTSKNAGQPSLMKFLINNKCNQENQDNAYNILTLTTQGGNIHNTINPNNVKLLSDDNAGIDFLTLCAVKRSEEEMSSETVRKMDTTYIPVASPVKDPFNFVIPDIEVLDSLPLLITDLINHLTTKDENTQHDNDHVNIDDDNFYCTIRNQKNFDTNEIRFEDVLDDSDSDTNITTISHVSQAISEIKVDLIDKSQVPASSAKDNNKIITNYARTELSNNMLNDMEPSIFENILNNSFSSTDDDLDIDDTAQQNIVPLKSSDVPNKNTENMNVTYESIDDIFLDDTDDEFNQNLSTSAKPVQLYQTNKPTENYIDEIQDLYFSDDDMTEFTCNKPNDSKPVHNSKPEESFLSITQAIKEIRQTKKDPEKSPILSASQRDSSPEWISTDTKHKTEVEKRNTCSRLENKLSDVNLNFTTKSLKTTNQEFYIQDDSDEDFTITEDNVKEFDELESSYFYLTSKTSRNQSNHSPNTSKNSVNKSNHFDDTSQSVLPGSRNLCNASKKVTPFGMPMPVDNKRPLLSLKRNRNPYSSTIDLNVFKAPSKCISNKREQNTLESGVGTSKQISRLDKEVAREINSKRNKRKRTRERNMFIDDEAEVSSSDSSDESISTIDEDLQDFVSYTQNVEEQVDMQAHYLQTVKDPIRTAGAFHFKKPRSPDPNIEIYSQACLSQAQDSYLYDSFCVKEDAEMSMIDDYSILEMAERELERNKRKRPHSNKTSAKQTSKRKNTNILNKSVSSEDEIEQLRIQVQEN